MIREADQRDLQQIADIFQLSFAQSVNRLAGEGIKRRAILDLFSLLLELGAARCYVAVEEERVLGYLVVLTRIRGFWFQVLRGGHPLRWLWRFLQGEYGLNLRQLVRILYNKFSFIFFALLKDSSWQAQILSLAVAPAARGRGLGRALMERGLEELDQEGVQDIKLEVRPENKDALHLYRSLGFILLDHFCDSQGRWLVMLRKPADD